MTSTRRSYLNRLARRAAYREQEQRFKNGQMTEGEAELFRLTRKSDRKPPPVLVTIYRTHNNGLTYYPVRMPANVLASAGKYARVFNALSQPFEM